MTPHPHPQASCIAIVNGRPIRRVGRVYRIDGLPGLWFFTLETARQHARTMESRNAD